MKDERVCGWFAGPSGENADRFSQILTEIYDDYVYWRRNCFPGDGAIIDSHAKRVSEPFWDDFSDRLNEMLGRLKEDFPFQSPRYAAHMISEQTLPSIAGMFAGMLYNPNNVSSEAAPVTVRMESEVCRWICRMLGYGDESWGHLTSGGTIANIEALWTARSALFLPLLVRNVGESLGIDISEREMTDRELLAVAPSQSLRSLHDCFSVATNKGIPTKTVLDALRKSEFNVVERGLAHVTNALNVDLVVLAPETCHYCVPKALDVLGIGRRAISYVEVDSQFRMRGDALQSKIEEAEKASKTILAVVGVAGTTEEGAIDPFHEIVSVREENQRSGRQSFWVHADAAYGGYLRTMVVPERIGLGDAQSEVRIDGEPKMLDVYRPYGTACDALESLGECDSIAIDPHKLGYVPYPAGAVCYRSNLVKPVLRQNAPYIADEAGPPSEERWSKSIGVYVMEGSKPGMVAASLWLSHGLIPLTSSAHGKLMQETVRNTGEFFTLVSDYPSLSHGARVRAVPLCEPGSNIVCYAFVPSSRKVGLLEANRANRRIYESFSSRTSGDAQELHSFFVSRTVIDPQRYTWESARHSVEALGGDKTEYEQHGAFFLRSVFMNPWYSLAKSRDKYFISDLVEALYAAATQAYDTSQGTSAPFLA